MAKILRPPGRLEIILKESAALFRDKGYGATSMNDIAEAVGIRAASLYNHITSKQQLLSALLMPIAEKFTAGMAEICAADLSPISRIERLVALHVRLTVAHPGPIALITGEWVHLEEPDRSTFLGQRNTYEKQFLEIIEACIAGGAFSPIDSRVALFSMLSTLHALHSWWRKHPGDPAVLESQMVHCLVEGLRQK